jgi:hypothetical protein
MSSFDMPIHLVAQKTKTGSEVRVGSMIVPLASFMLRSATM